METKFQTSFIPKAPVTDSSAGRRSGGAGFLFLIAFIIFMASLCAAVGVFFYNQILDQKIKTGNEELSQNQNIFNPNVVQEYSRLNDRINASYEILKKHVAVSNLFSIISAVTLKNVRFSNFTYSNAGSDKISLNMNGQTRSYELVALQARALTDPTMKYRNAFKSPILGDLNVDSLGNVSFNLSSAVDPSVVSYYRLVQDLKKSGQLEDYANAGAQSNPASQVGTTTPAVNFNNS